MREQIRNILLFIPLIILFTAIALNNTHQKDNSVTESNLLIGNFNLQILQHSSAESPENIILSDQSIGDIPFASSEQITSSKGFDIKKFGDIKDNEQVILKGNFDELKLNIPIYQENTPKPPVTGYQKESVLYFNATGYEKIDFYKITLPPEELLKYLNGENASFQIQLNNPTDKELKLYISFGDGSNLESHSLKTITLQGHEKRVVVIPYSTDANDASDYFILRITSYPPEIGQDFRILDYPVVSINDYRIHIYNALNKGDVAFINDYDVKDITLLENALDDSNQMNKDILLESYRALAKKYLFPDKYSQYYSNGVLNDHVVVLSCIKPSLFESECTRNKITSPDNTFYSILVIYNWGYTTAFNQRFNFTNISYIEIEKIELFNANRNEYEEISKDFSIDITPLKKESLLYESAYVEKDSYNPDYITIAIRMKARSEGKNHIEFYFGEQKISQDIEMYENA